MGMLSFIIVVFTIVEKVNRVKRQYLTLSYVNVFWWLLYWNVRLQFVDTLFIIRLRSNMSIGRAVIIIYELIFSTHDGGRKSNIIIYSSFA